MNEIRIAAAVIINEQGELLLVRKRFTDAFMQAGGKIEPGESAVEALCRELSEELRLQIEPEQPEYLGRFRARAANENDLEVRAELFLIRIGFEAEPCAELSEVLWMRPEEAHSVLLAPLTRQYVLDIARERLR
ncbi:NUDIX hydrolase [Ruegeria atlantica]|uniref:NUDIX hydrolase n=1 Tax=Ruegeria atlantica TaxID=81569 RepID=UPI00147D9C31|nr:NUDIX domain-containing protein [Ruegeria atlantica]